MATPPRPERIETIVPPKESTSSRAAAKKDKAVAIAPAPAAPTPLRELPTTTLTSVAHINPVVRKEPVAVSAKKPSGHNVTDHAQKSSAVVTGDFAEVAAADAERLIKASKKSISTL